MTSGIGSDTAQRLTSATPGAIGVIALTGPNALTSIQRYFRSIHGNPISQWPVPSIRFGHWNLDAQHTEELVVARLSEEKFELHCHAGLVVQSILNQLQALGITLREPNVSQDTLHTLPLEQQAQHLLLQATTETTAAILLDQQRGALRRELQEILALLDHGAKQLAQHKLQDLLSFSAVGSHLISPWHVQLAGPPNVGKSSLLNSILGYRRAIVHDSAGTTRDLVQATTSLNGWPFRFTDSAGVRDATNLGEAESIGIERALAAANTMDVVLLILEPTHGLTSVHQLFLERFADKTLLVLNQIDRLSPAARSHSITQFKALGVSAHTNEGLPELLSAIERRLISSVPTPGQAIPFLPHHLQSLHKSLAALQIGQIPLAAAELRELMSVK